MRFAIKDAANVTLHDRVKNLPLFYTRDLNTFNVKLEGESVYAKAKGDNAIAFDGALTGTVNMEAEVIQFDQLAVILASTMETGDTDIAERQLLTADGSSKVTLTDIIPVNNSLSVFAVEADGVSHLEALKFTSATTSSNTEITIINPVPEGTKVAVYYMVKKPNVKTITVKNVSSAPNYRITGDTACKNDQGQNVVMAIDIPNCKVKRSIEMSFTAENPSNFNTELDILPDENGDYVKLSFIGEATDPIVRLKSLQSDEMDFVIREDSKTKK
ncbi:hypothetical protein [Metaclostridioides mangenotii]|uniref:hypothetical protein n=1 Tax=Metaclostridioides mangenotii TaxID=1540 RepID=UPI000465AA31|nr:hypothetical protein [Clostridioides mangenotii]